MQQSPSSRASRPVLVFIAALFVALAARMFHLIATRAVNLLWWDEWDLYAAFMRYASWWQLFRWQHTAHREGISFVLLEWLEQATSWNSKDAAYLVALFVVLSAALALALKRKITGCLQFADGIILLIFFTPMQYEIFLGPSLPAFSSFPVFLILLCCLAWLIADIRWRYAAVLVINFLTLYSGYGVFLGFVVPILLLLNLIRALRRGETRNAVLSAGSLVIAAASLVSFFVRYAFVTAADCYRFPLHPLYGYPWFAALMLANPFRLKGHGPLATVIGALLLVLFLWILLRNLRGLCRRDEDLRRVQVSATLFGFSALYIASAAIGRLCFGVEYAQESRYVVFANLAVFGFYLEALAMNRLRLRRAVLAVLSLGMLVGNFYPSHRDSAQAQYFFETKTRWKACYLRTEDISRCDAEAGGVAYPNPAATHMTEKLDYLKANRLNLFSGR